MRESPFDAWNVGTRRRGKRMLMVPQEVPVDGKKGASMRNIAPHASVQEPKSKPPQPHHQ